MCVIDKMSFITGYQTKFVSNSINLNFDPSEIWDEITDVMVAKFKFPFLFKLFGIPKPLSAEVIKKGIGGYRIAVFSNNEQFQQEILEWDVNKAYRFKFNPTQNFKVGHFMNLSNGPFQIQTGGYQLLKTENGIDLILSSNYKLKDYFGSFMHVPFRLVVYAFQRYLLKGIKENLRNNITHH